MAEKNLSSSRSLSRFILYTGQPAGHSGLFAPILSDPSGIEDEKTVESGDRIELLNETHILFIACGQTAQEVGA